MGRPDAEGFRIVLTTVGSEEEARKLALELVTRRLAACVNVVGPVASFYRWKGEVVEDTERLLLVKTAVARLPELADAIRELHGYELPELLTLAIADGDPSYLGWLSDGLDPEKE